MLFLNIFCTKTQDVIILYELFLKDLDILYLVTLLLHNLCQTLLHSLFFQFPCMFDSVARSSPSIPLSLSLSLSLTLPHYISTSISLSISLSAFLPFSLSLSISLPLSAVLLSFCYYVCLLSSKFLRMYTHINHSVRSVFINKDKYIPHCCTVMP